MFIVTVILITGLINFYLFRVAAAGFPEATLLLGLVATLLFLSLYIAVFLERSGRLRLSLPFSWIGYTWLGVSGLALVLAALSDAAQLVLVDLDNREQAILVGSVTILLCLIAAFSAQRFSVKHVDIRTTKFDEASRPVTIVQITDLHLGDSSSLGRTRRVVDAVNALAPDIVVSTGDLFDGYLDLMDPYVELLREFKAPMGRFAVIGNHEVYAGLGQSIALTETAGFRVLRGESAQVGPSITIAGVDDPSFSAATKEAEALAGLDRRRFTLLLKHRPQIERGSIGKFDLQLSGHTHGGQIAPFHLLTGLAFKARPGLSAIADNQHLYLSRGTGSWGPQLRLLAPSEITVFRIGEQ